MSQGAKRNYRGIILAAGFGTRLLPLTRLIPKPLVPLGRQTLVEMAIERLTGAGIHEIAINLHHLGQRIQHFLGSGERYGCEFHYFEEPKILGTGGALANAGGFLMEAPFIVLNSDAVCDLDLGKVLTAHELAGGCGTLVLRAQEGERYGRLRVDRESNVVDILGWLDHDGDATVSGHFMGAQVWEPEVLELFPRGYSETPKDLWLPLLKGRGVGAIKAYFYEGYFSDVGTWPRLLETHRRQLRIGVSMAKASVAGSAPPHPGYGNGFSHGQCLRQADGAPGNETGRQEEVLSRDEIEIAGPVWIDSTARFSGGVAIGPFVTISAG